MQDTAEPTESSAPLRAPREAEFPVWLAARERSLQRTAHLLTGDIHSAQDLVLDTLARLYLAWDRIGDPGAVDAHATRILVNEHRLSWRRSFRRRTPPSGADVPSTPAEYDDRRHAVRELVDLLPGSQRADVALRFIEQLTPADLDTLRERAVESDYPYTPTATVVARARALRAHRRRTAAMVVAAAAVLAGPAAMWLGGSARSNLAADGHDGSSTTAAVQPVGPWSGLEPGPPPTIPYVQGSRYHAADGTVTTLPFHEYGLQAAAYRGGFLVVHTVRQGSRLTRLDDHLRPRWSTCASGARSLVTSPDGSRVAFETRDCATQVSSIHLTSAAGTGGQDRVYRVSGHHRVSLTGATETTVGYAYWPPRRGPSGPAFVTDFQDRALDVPTTSSSFALDPNGNEVTVGADTGTGFAVVDVRTGAVRWRSSTPIVAFSEDGSSCVAQSPDSTELLLLDAGDGRLLQTLLLPKGLVQVAGPVWDRDDTVLVVASHVDAAGSDTAIVRFGLRGGQPTLATRVVRTDRPGTGFSFAGAAD